MQPLLKELLHQRQCPGHRCRRHARTRFIPVTGSELTVHVAQHLKVISVVVRGGDPLGDVIRHSLGVAGAHPVKPGGIPGIQIRPAIGGHGDVVGANEIIGVGRRGVRLPHINGKLIEGRVLDSRPGPDIHRDRIDRHPDAIEVHRSLRNLLVRVEIVVVVGRVVVSAFIPSGRTGRDDEGARCDNIRLESAKFPLDSHTNVAPA